MTSKIDTTQFEEYCWEFYGPGTLYGHLFENSMPREELKMAIAIRMYYPLEFSGDSTDRELVRDILLFMRDEIESETIEKAFEKYQASKYR